MHNSKRERRVAILGAGMLGSTLAILLARRAVRVTLFDAAARPMNRTGRWNEGKVHLGYVYAADRSLNTARKLIPGGVAFRPIVEDLIDQSIEAHLTPEDELFLTHRNSVVDPDSTLRHLRAVWNLAPEAQAGRTPPTALTRAELERITENPEIVAGFRVPEKSVDTNWLADRLADRIASDRLIECRCDCLVTALSKARGSWSVSTDCEAFGGFDAVVNALWEGKSVIDESVGRLANELLSYRYRVAAFVKVPQATISSAIITTGPFGDIKNYDGRHIYLSWYPAGLLVDCRSKHAPPSPELDGATEREICGRIVEALGGFFQGVLGLPASAEAIAVRGGGLSQTAKACCRIQTRRCTAAIHSA